MSTEHDTRHDRAKLPNERAESTIRMNKRLFAGIALALALAFTGSVAVGQQYWNPDAAAVSAVA
ncbi:hypothetical protein ILP97_26530 [Amycolatopsis sp. H6(2020)]|nr:hypothetical protein [Amycolatopsis sp. H6(2020)]